MKLSDLLAYLHPKWRKPFGPERSRGAHGKPETCEACGQPFRCGASLAGCWCAEIQLSEPMRADLRKRYRRCLCRGCLERFAAADSSRAG